MLPDDCCARYGSLWSKPLSNPPDVLVLPELLEDVALPVVAPSAPVSVPTSVVTG